MFVEEKAMGEPYWPKKPYCLPKGIYAAIYAPIVVAIFCFAVAVSYSLIYSLPSSNGFSIESISNPTASPVIRNTSLSTFSNSRFPAI